MESFAAIFILLLAPIPGGLVRILTTTSLVKSSRITSTFRLRDPPRTIGVAGEGSLTRMEPIRQQKPAKHHVPS